MTSIHGLTHRCTVWQPASRTTDAYGQPAPAAFTQTATGVRCRLNTEDQDTPQVLLTATVPVAVDDRITDVQDTRGNTIDAGPFAIIDVDAVRGRARVAYRRLTLRRLTSIDQT